MNQPPTAMDRSELSSDFLKALPYETPFFVFDRSKILRNFSEFGKHFPGSALHYAMKANSEPEVLATLASAGSGFEVASRYELEMLQRLNVPPERIIYGSAVKPVSHIEAFFEYGVDLYAFDSPSELLKIASAAPGSKVYVRSSVDDSASVFKFSGKFGADQSEIVPLLRQARELDLRPYGISFHVGSQASDPRAWAKTVRALGPTIAELGALGVALEVLNLGGGFPCRYASSSEAPTLEEIAEHTLREVERLPVEVKLILEPGRGLIAQTAVLITSVIARIQRRGVDWLFLDAGVYNALFEAMAYQGSTRYHVACMRPTLSTLTRSFALAGPTGDSPDIITTDVLLPDDIDVGDKLLIHDVGAYSLSVTSTFNGFPRADVYFL